MTFDGLKSEPNIVDGSSERIHNSCLDRSKRCIKVSILS